MDQFRRFVSQAAAMLLVGAVLVGGALPGQAANCPGAGTVKSAASALMAAARRGSLAGFASTLSRHADVSAISMFALGKYRGNLPSARRGEYIRNTHRYMSRFLADHAGRFRSSSNLAIDRCDGNLIETTVNGGSRMVWRLSGGRIRDLRVEGVWLGLQLRSRFSDIIRRNNGDVGKLVDYLAHSE
jgi:hypothetical protein